MKKESLLFGVGINDADYTTRLYEELPRVNGKRRQKLVWICPFYATWKSMLDRCYSPSRQKKQPYYKGCSVDTAWWRFSTFKAWMETQDWEGNQLDKDLLCPGNKLYSPETCVFISRKVNMFITEARKNKGLYPTGVVFLKNLRKFRACCTNDGVAINLGCFRSAEDAHGAWLECKLTLARLLAEQQSDPRVAEALISRYENYH